MKKVVLILTCILVLGVLVLGVITDNICIWFGNPTSLNINLTPRLEFEEAIWLQIDSASWDTYRDNGIGFGGFAILGNADKTLFKFGDVLTP